MQLVKVLLSSKVRWILLLVIVSSGAAAQTVHEIRDLSHFRDPGPSWQLAGKVLADLENPGVLKVSDGKETIVNLPSKKKAGQDIYTVQEFGDMDLELDFLMARGSNSGIYLQGRYEIQLLDSWGVQQVSSGDNGGIYERWDPSRPKGQEGYEGRAPRQNASLAPGLWQKLKVTFRAPRFDAQGRKTENAVIERVELNGVTLHENVVLSGPTRGPMSEEESARGPLRIQGDHGAVAFRNIRITSYESGRAEEEESRGYVPDPILVNAPVNTLLRSFMDTPGGNRVVQGISAGSSRQVHYTYDMGHGALIQVWRGGFLDATPMWHSRGDGSSRPLGANIFLCEPVLSLARLSSGEASWPQDTTGSGFTQKGYTVDKQEQPVFNYRVFGTTVKDASRAMEDGKGIVREIQVQPGVSGLYHLLARSERIEQISSDTYMIGDSAWYLRLGDMRGSKPVLREKEGKQELIIPVNQGISYSILF